MQGTYLESNGLHCNPSKFHAELHYIYNVTLMRVPKG